MREGSELRAELLDPHCQGLSPQLLFLPSAVMGTDDHPEQASGQLRWRTPNLGSVLRRRNSELPLPPDLASPGLEGPLDCADHQVVPLSTCLAKLPHLCAGRLTLQCPQMIAAKG